MEHASKQFKEGHLAFAKRMILKKYPNLKNKIFEIGETMQECFVCKQQTLPGFKIRIEGEEEWREVPPVLSKCNACENEMLKNRAKKAQKANRSRRFWKPNEELEAATFETFEPQDKAQAQAFSTSAKYVKDFKNDDRYNLVLRGPYGAGKSHLAKSIGESLKADGYAVGFITTEELLTMIKSTFNRESGITEEQLLQKLNDLDLLILDELGAETSTGEWARNKIISLINSRQGKYTIYTTNESDDSLARLFTGRVPSRLKSNTKFEEVKTDIDMRVDKQRG